MAIPSPSHFLLSSIFLQRRKMKDIKFWNVRCSQLQIFGEVLAAFSFPILWKVKWSSEKKEKKKNWVFRRNGSIHLICQQQSSFLFFVINVLFIYFISKYFPNLTSFSNEFLSMSIIISHSRLILLVELHTRIKSLL